jgi:outer membrane receptor protein involved in Fe transport
MVCALAAGSAMAQSTKGGIEGTVMDDAGIALPGVTVVISSDSMQGTKTAITGADGEFRFVLLPIGTYEAVFTLSGFQTVEQQNVRVPLEGVITLEVGMSSTFSEEVLVTGESPVLDVTSTTIGTAFSGELLSDIPAARDASQVSFLAAGAVDGGGKRTKELAGNPSIMGASALENRYVVDEMDTSDPAFGYAGSGVSFNFVEEVQVKTGGYEAEYGGAMGGVINMITKSGGNEFHGDVFAYYLDEGIGGGDPTIPESAGSSITANQEIDVGFTLGGRIIRDKLWFFAAYNPNELELQVVNDVLNPDFELIQTNSLVNTFNRDYYTAKLTWQISNNHSVNLNLLGDPTDVENDYSSLFYVDVPYVETDLTYNPKRGGLNYGALWNGILSDNSFIEFNVGHHENEDTFTPNLNTTNYQDQTADGRWTLGAGDSAFFGGANSQQPGDSRERDSIKGAFTWFAGNHELKFGAGYNKVEYDMDYNMAGPSDSFCAPAHPEYGILIFDADLGEGVPAVLDCDISGDGTNDGLIQPARVGNRYRLRNGYYYNRNYKNQSTGKSEDMNLYAQDSWRIVDNLTVMFGVRAESLESTGNNSDFISDTGLVSKFDFGFSDMIAPRLGFTWDFAGNGRSKAYGHYGRFYQAIPLNLNVRSFGNESYDFYYYYYPENGLLPGVDNPGYMTYIYPSGPTRVDPDIEPTYIEEIVFGGEYEVATDLAIGAKYVYREVGEAIEDISVDEGNSYYITNPGGTFDFNPATGAPLDEPALFPTVARFYRGIELTANKRFSNNWQLFASLLYSKLEGNYEGFFSRDNQQVDPAITSKFDLPDLLTNARGMLPNDREWQFKVYGSYLFDFGLVTGYNFYYMTGHPMSKLGAHRLYGQDERFITQRGSEGRSPDLWNFDLRFAYPIPIGGFNLELSMDIFNVFNNQDAVENDQRWTSLADDDYPEPIPPELEPQTNPTWNEAFAYQDPRRIRLGVKFSW